jgi:pimeloyl-ACP methyl ester carboxylesterase
MFKYFHQDEDVEWVKQTGHRGWSFQMIRLISQSHFGGGQFSEAHEAARRIRYGDDESWLREWTRLGERLEGMAAEAERNGHFLTARDRYLRASNYFRTGEFFVRPDDPRKLQTYDQGIECFRKAGRYFRPPLERVRVPYEGTTLPGYFIPARNAPLGPTPAVIFFGGSDSTAEELYFLLPGLVERGLAMLIVDGPGQGSALRHQGLFTRPDWEVPATAAYEYLAERPEVDPNRIAIIALSFGGYLAPRAAAFEHRFAACVAWGAHYDLYEFWSQRPDDHPLAVNWQWILGAKGMPEARELMKAYNFRGILGRIECPTLVVMGQEDGETRLSHGRRMFSELRCPRTFKLFTSEETGAAHCQMDNLTLANEYIGDWLTDVLVRGKIPAGDETVS